MNKLTALLTFCLLLTLNASAQSFTTDRDWYIAGEDILLDVFAAPSEAEAKVGYVEVCDASRLAAAATIALTDGRGVGRIELPRTMHSGLYLVSFYTRTGTTVAQRHITVVNTLVKSDEDNLEWQEAATTLAPASALTVIHSASGIQPVEPEREGHTILARITRSAADAKYTPSQINCSLSVVGKQVHVFNGRMLNDSTVAFYTYNVNNRQPVVLMAETFDGISIPIVALSPYRKLLDEAAAVKPVFNYSRKEVTERSERMQTIVRTDSVAPLPFSSKVFGVEPTLSYNLDEYRPFATIREVLLEYVANVHRAELDGRQQLFVFNQQEGYSDWPALVLLDGMPVKDIERLLRYDARRVSHILIYESRYALGHDLYKGILNIVTRTGKLTNFPPEKQASYIVYDFPQYYK